MSSPADSSVPAPASAARTLRGRAGRGPRRASTVVPWKAARKNVLYALNRAAATYWHQQLLKNERVLAYLRDERGWPDPVALARKYRLGYAPGQGDGAPGFVQLVLQRGFPGTDGPDDLRQALLAAGLARTSADGQRLRDHFYGRLIFPIADAGSLDALNTPEARIAGFGGRLIPRPEQATRPDGKTPPKYLNTSETVLFRKREILYGLSWAHAAIDATKQVTVIEGYMDHLRVVEAGFTNAVACCGTALTPDHVAQLRKAARDVERRVRVSTRGGARQAAANRPHLEVTVMTDADAAGRRAAEKAARVVLQGGARAKIATFDDGKDPDEVLRAAGDAGPERFQEILDKAQTPVINYLDVQAEAHGGPWWGTSLRALVSTLRQVQRRGAGAPADLQARDAQQVATRFRLETRLPFAESDIRDLFRIGDADAIEEPTP